VALPCVVVSFKADGEHFFFELWGAFWAHISPLEHYALELGASTDVRYAAPQATAGD
jgi:hypothetical protein